MRAILGLAALLAAAGLAAAEPAVANGGFEDWTGALPAGWSVPWAALGRRAEVTRSAEPPAGASALRLVSLNPGAADRAWAAVLRQGPLAGADGDRPWRISFLARGERDGQALGVLLYAEPSAGPAPERHWFRSAEVVLGRAWTRHRVELRPPPAAVRPPLYLHFQLLAGAVELDEVTVEPGDPAPAAPAAGRRNLLDDPGFEVGGEAWTCTAWNNAAERLPQLVEGAGRDGGRCLRLPGGGESLESRRYPVAPGRPWTLSAWVRAPAPPATGAGLRLFLLTPDWKRGELALGAERLSREWRRLHLTFTPPPADDAYAAALSVRLDPAVELEVDDLQLEEGAAPTPFAAGAQVGLEVEAAEALVGARPFAVRLRARLDRPRACRARLRACDLRGEVCAEAAIDLGEVGPAPVERSWTVPWARPGLVRLHAELVAADDGAVLAAGAARALAVEGEPTGPHPLIGIDNQPLRLPGARTAQVERLAATVVGAGRARVFFESVAGVRWGMEEDGDDYLALARSLLGPEVQRGRPVLACLEPSRASPLRLRRQRAAGRPPSEEEFAREVAAYAARAGRVAAGMRGVLAGLELLNEPNIWDVRGAAGMPAERYARLVAAAAPAIRAAAPGMAVAANVNGVDLPYLAAFLRAGGAVAVDALTVHPYRATPESPPIHDDLLRLRRLADQHRPGLRIECTEQYFGSREDPFANFDEYPRAYIAEGEAEQAARSIQALLHALAAGVPYTLFGPERTLYRPTLAGMRWFAAAGLVRQAARALAGVEAGEEVAAHPSCRAFLFPRRDGVRVVALAAREHGRAGTLVLPEGCRACDAEGAALAGPRVAVDDLPLYLLFAPGPSPAAIAARLRAAAWSGFDFPLTLRLEERGGALTAVVGNRGPATAGGELEIAEAPPGWPRPRLAVPPLAPGASHRAPLGPLPAAAPGTVAGVRWSGRSGDQAGTGWSRLPALRIPRRAAAWPEGAWIALGEQALSRDFSAGRRPHRGPADLAARVALAWDGGGLHLAVEVQDDRRAEPPADPAALWQSDSLQVYCDPRDAAQGGRRGADRGDAAWLVGPGRAGGTCAWMTLNPGDRYLGAENAETGPDPLVEAAWQATAAGWSARLRLPPPALPGLRLEPGARCGLALLINDDDGDGRKPGLVLGPAGGEPHEQPWLWPCAELED